METKPFFLPSEVARLVLGYLISQGFDQTSKCFLIECEYLAEFKKLKSMGLEYPTNILGLSLVEILDNFGFTKTQALERYKLTASTDVLWRELDSCLDKLKYRMFQSGPNRVNISKIRNHRKFPDRNVKTLPGNIAEMLLKQGKILTSKQLAQNMIQIQETKKVNENIKMDVENSSTYEIVYGERQDVLRAPMIPVKELPGNVEVDKFEEVIKEPVPIPAKSNDESQNRNQDKRDNNGNQETITVPNSNSQNTGSIFDPSPSSQIPTCHKSESADNPILSGTSEESAKQPDTGNTNQCVPTPKIQLPSSGINQTSKAEEITTAPELGVSVTSQLEASDSKCKAQPLTKPQPLYESVGTQSDLSLLKSPFQPNISPSKPHITTPVETIPSTSTEVQVAVQSESLPLIPESTSNTELSPSANTFPVPMEVTSDQPPVGQDVSKQENNLSTDSVLKDSVSEVAVVSLSLSSSPPPSLLLSSSTNSFPNVYKTPVKNLQNQYTTPCKENSESETLNTPTRDKNTSFPESLTPGKQSESDNAKSKRKRCPPEKRFVDTLVPGSSQVRYDSGNSQDSSHLKDPIPTFVEKVITETSLPKFLAETINRKLYGDTKSETMAKNNENKNVEDGQKVECDKLMDEIMLTDFHMTKSDIDEVIHQTSSAGIPVLDDLLKLFASVSEEKDNFSDEECTEPVYDSVEFEGLDSCSQSAQNKQIKLVTSEDELSKSNLKITKEHCDMNSLSKSPTFLQVVDKLCSSSETLTEISTNQATEDLSLKTFHTTLDEENKDPNSEKIPVPPKMLSDSESIVKYHWTSSETINSSDNPNPDQTSLEAKEISVIKQPTSCSRRTKVFSKGKSKKLFAPSVLSSANTNQSSVTNPPDSPAVSIPSFPTLNSPSKTAITFDTSSHTTQCITSSLASDTHSTNTVLTSESTIETTITSSDILIPISSNNSFHTTTTLSKISHTNITSSSVENIPPSVSSDLPTEYSPVTTSNSSLSKLTTVNKMIPPAPSLIQTSTEPTLLTQPPFSSTNKSSTNKIITTSISESSSVVPQIIQPEATASVTKYPVMYIIAPQNSNTPLQFQPTQIPVLDPAAPNYAYPNVPWSSVTNKIVTLVPQELVSFQKPLEVNTECQNPNTKPKRPRGRPKKDPKLKPAQPKIYNIAPNKDLNTLSLLNVGKQFSPQKKVTLAMSHDNSWTIEMQPGTETVILNLKSPHMNQFVSYQLTAEQVKDHLDSFIGTSTITDHILKRMEEFEVPKSECKVNILSKNKVHKKKPLVSKEMSLKQPVTGESSGQTQVGSHQRNDCLARETENKQIGNSVQKDEEILFIATPLGSVNELLKKVQTETKESPKLITSSPLSALQTMKINDSRSSPLVVKESSSPNLNPSSSREKASAEKNDNSYISGLPLNFSKKDNENNCYNNNDNVKIVDPTIKDNEYLAIDILSNLCYSQRESSTKADLSVDAMQPEEKAEGHSFCDSSEASPARCYKILMEGREEGQANNQLVDLSDKPSEDLKEQYRDMPSDLNSIFGYVDPGPAVRKSLNQTSQIKYTDSHLKQGNQTLVHSEEGETDCKKETNRSSCKKSVNKSPGVKKRKSVKRKLYEAFGDKNLSEQTENKINRMDIDLLLARLHPDSLDGVDGNT